MMLRRTLIPLTTFLAGMVLSAFIARAVMSARLDSSEENSTKALVMSMATATGSAVLEHGGIVSQQFLSNPYYVSIDGRVLSRDELIVFVRSWKDHPVRKVRAVRSSS